MGNDMVNVMRTTYVIKGGSDTLAKMAKVIDTHIEKWKEDNQSFDEEACRMHRRYIAMTDFLYDMGAGVQDVNRNAHIWGKISTGTKRLTKKSLVIKADEYSRDTAVDFTRLLARLFNVDVKWFSIAPSALLFLTNDQDFKVFKGRQFAISEMRPGKDGIDVNFMHYEGSIEKAMSQVQFWLTHAENCLSTKLDELDKDETRSQIEKDRLAYETRREFRSRSYVVTPTEVVTYADDMARREFDSRNNIRS